MSTDLNILVAYILQVVHNQKLAGHRNLWWAGLCSSVRFDVLTVVLLQIQVFWDVTLCRDHSSISHFLQFHHHNLSQTTKGSLWHSITSQKTWIFNPSTLVHYFQSFHQCFLSPMNCFCIGNRPGHSTWHHTLALSWSLTPDLAFGWAGIA